MRPVTERDIRTSSVNCSKAEAKRLDLPGDLADHPREDLDVLGWRDPGSPPLPRLPHIAHHFSNRTTQKISNKY
ncbi:FBP domain-containing protein [Streptosporangium roseum]|uniref:FBP domain-containing protein n=1 Tax=Streptosporangium roseum TaxID=2001 RepID=UPI003D9F3209